MSTKEQLESMVSCLHDCLKKSMDAYSNGSYSDDDEYYELKKALENTKEFAEKRDEHIRRQTITSIHSSMKTALKKAEHDLTFLNGCIATDKEELFDPELSWKVDHTKLLKEIKEAFLFESASSQIVFTDEDGRDRGKIYRAYI